MNCIDNFIHHPIRRTHVMHNQMGRHGAVHLKREWAWKGCAMTWKRHWTSTPKALLMSFCAVSCHAVNAFSEALTRTGINYYIHESRQSMGMPHRQLQMEWDLPSLEGIGKCRPLTTPTEATGSKCWDYSTNRRTQKRHARPTSNSVPQAQLSEYHFLCRTWRIAVMHLDNSSIACACSRGNRIYHGLYWFHGGVAFL